MYGSDVRQYGKIVIGGGTTTSMRFVFSITRAGSRPSWLFDGVNYFHYYGELLQPELSNMQIWTTAVGFRFWQSSSVEFVYHLYHQVHPAAFLRNARIDADPTGKRRAIGQEWDVVVGLQEWKTS
jgi:alginate production protein